MLYWDAVGLDPDARLRAGDSSGDDGVGVGEGDSSRGMICICLRASIPSVSAKSSHAT